MTVTSKAPKVYSCRKGAHPSPPPGSVYVGRRSGWGNPYVMGVDGTRDEVIAMYSGYLEEHPEIIVAAKRELRGRDLVCWCAPRACHADILLEIANS